jgi:hypothetical protein
MFERKIELTCESCDVFSLVRYLLVVSVTLLVSIIGLSLNCITLFVLLTPM